MASSRMKPSQVCDSLEQRSTRGSQGLDRRDPLADRHRHRIQRPALGPQHQPHSLSHSAFPLWHGLGAASRFGTSTFASAGHVVGYGILSILLFRAWRATLPACPTLSGRLRWATIAILGTALVASLDEWHQSFIPSRTGRWQDVVLDTCAGIAAQMLMFLW